MIVENKRNIKEIEQEKSQKIMETVAWRAGYYRANPQRFCKDILNITLKWFQVILLWAMMHNNFFMYLAARGQGKTFLTAIFLVCRCVLYPNSKIIVTSATLKQANEVLLKIQDEIYPHSSILQSCIKEMKIGQNDATILFKGGSWIKTRTSTENSRSARANIIVVDEFRMVDKKILDSVIREFLKAPRHPKYLDKPEYAHLTERNKELYLSSAYFKSSWAYTKAISYTQDFFNDKKKYFICGLPYQLSIRENLLDRGQVEDQMGEADFNEIAFSMEDECLWYGDTEGGLFKFDSLNKIRRIKHCLYPLEYYNEKFSIPKPINNSRRIMSVDIALMASTNKKKNDASSIYINDAIQNTNASYQSNIIFGQNFEGLTTDELGIIVMRYFYKYKCTDLVIDTNGVGLGVADFIAKDQYDPETGEVYGALCCCNNDEMAARCKVPSALKVVWSVKATADFNNTICVLLRNAINNGKINFLIPEQNADEVIAEEYKPYKKMTPMEQAKMKMSYAQCTLGVYELVKLKYFIKNNKITVFEPSGCRKDRYSSIAYNYWCASQLELQLRPYNEDTESLVRRLTIKKGRLKINTL